MLPNNNTGVMKRNSCVTRTRWKICQNIVFVLNNTPTPSDNIKTPLIGNIRPYDREQKQASFVNEPTDAAVFKNPACQCIGL